MAQPSWQLWRPAQGAGPCLCSPTALCGPLSTTWPHASREAPPAHAPHPLDSPGGRQPAQCLIPATAAAGSWPLPNKVGGPTRPRLGSRGESGKPALQELRLSAGQVSRLRRASDAGQVWGRRLRALLPPRKVDPPLHSSAPLAHELPAGHFLRHPSPTAQCGKNKQHLRAEVLGQGWRCWGRS